jgi:hypothetical protein
MGGRAVGKFLVGVLRTLLFTGFCGLLAGCTQGKPGQEAGLVVPPPASGARAAVPLFPTAVSAVAYTGIDLAIGPDGRAMVSPTIVRQNTTPVLVPAPPIDRAVLSTSELHQLQASVFFGPKPAYGTMNSCNFMGAFFFYDGVAFYDAGGRYLGNLTVCPGTGPAVISPAPINESGLPLLHVDFQVLDHIMSNHQLSSPNFADDISPDTQKIPAPIFPGAVRVEAYVGENITVSKDGSVTMGNLRMVSAAPPIAKEFPEPVPPAQMAALTPAEINAVQNSVYFTQIPGAASACICDFRHAFTFFDAKGKYLGYFAMCFACGCMEIQPSIRDNTVLPATSWDGRVLYGIFQAHRLKP